MRIGQVNTPNNVFLAPMAGITDRPFRLICKQMGAGLVVSEMVSAKGIWYDNENTKTLLTIHEEEHPVSVQLFGSDPHILSEIAKKIEGLPFDIIDINMGCPAPKIVKNGEGCALMKDPKRIGEIVKAVSRATKKPVTIKIRKGFSESTQNAVEVAKKAEDCGASAIAIHGRTREQFYSGQADWSMIAAVKEAVSIPIIGNGDVTTPQKAKQMLEQTKCDAVMVGRAAQGNPFIFREIVHYLQTGELLLPPTQREKICLALSHAKAMASEKGEYLGVLEMRKHLCWYLKGIPSAASSRVAINHATSLGEVEDILQPLIE